MTAKFKAISVEMRKNCSEVSMSKILVAIGEHWITNEVNGFKLTLSR